MQSSTQPTQVPSPFRSFQTIWDYLRQSHASISDIEMRRQSRLLAGLLIALIFGAGTASLILSRNAFSEGLSQQTLFLWFGLALLVAIFFLNRMGHYRLSAGLFIALNFAMVHFIPIATGDYSWLFFTNMFLVLSATLLPMNRTLALFGLSLLIQISIRLVSPSPVPMSNLSTIIIFGVTGPLILVFVQHRAGLEAERRIELQKANAALRESESVLEQRVAERTEELRIAKDEAEKSKYEAEDANKVKSQFLANMSHELRTPLNAILNFTAFVADGVIGPVNEEQAQLLNESISSSKHLLALINDILDVSKIEAGLMDLFIQDVDMNEILNATSSVAKGLLKNSNVQLQTQIEEKLPISYGDKRRLRQVFLNLVSNAVKFTKEGSISICAKLQEGLIRIEVKDTGLGIPEEDFGLIFESFKQSKHDNLDSVGTGLGLPISKFFIEAHGGKMWVESQVGIGSTFFVELPILTEAEANVLTLRLKEQI